MNFALSALGTFAELREALAEALGGFAEALGGSAEVFLALVEALEAGLLTAIAAVEFGFEEETGFLGVEFAAFSELKPFFDWLVWTFTEARAVGTNGEVRATDFRGGITAFEGVVSCGLGVDEWRRTLNRGFTTRCLRTVRGGGDSSLTTTESSSVLLRIIDGEVSSKMVSCDKTEISAGCTA